MYQMKITFNYDSSNDLELNIYKYIMFKRIEST